ncbi:DUF2214 family protein [Rhodobacter lacus]|uniref:DUF2214 family protein n=1 Tax=Rhodobacter lacus TaxID=1641972 RepID=A0ABW5ADH4_9RHOB
MILLIVKVLHLLGAAGCLGASAAKNLILRRDTLRGAPLLWLVRLDKVSGVSAVLVAATGIAMARGLAKPAALYLHDPLFWLKLALFIAASAAVIRTKSALRRARAAGEMAPSQRVRRALAFDFGALLILLALGRGIALGL